MGKINEHFTDLRRLKIDFNRFSLENSDSKHFSVLDAIILLIKH